MPPRRTLTLRPLPAVLQACEIEAAHKGESVSNFFVYAGFARAVMSWQGRGGPAPHILAEMYDQAPGAIQQMFELAADLGANWPDPPN